MLGDLTLEARNRVRRRIEGILPSGSMRARFVRGALWSLCAAALTQLMAMVTSVVIARTLSVADFGALTMVLNTVGMVGLFAGMGMGITAARYVAEYRQSDPRRAGRVIGLTNVVTAVTGIAVSGLVWATAPFIAAKALNAPHLANALRFGCGVLLFNSLAGTQAGVLIGLESFRVLTITRLLAGLVGLPCVVIGVREAGVAGALAGYAVGGAIGCLATALAVQRESAAHSIRAAYTDIGSDLPVLWRFAAPAVLSSAMIGPVTWLASVIVVRYPGGYHELGIYAAAAKFQMLIQMAASAAGAALLPLLASSQARGESFGRANMLVSWVMGAVPAIAITAFPSVIELAFGRQYSGAHCQQALVLVILATAVNLYRQGIARAVIAHGVLWWTVLDNTVWGLLAIAAVAYLRPWGAVGLAGSFALAYMAATAAFAPLYARRRLVPVGTIMSAEAAAVWLLLATSGALSFLQAPPLLRVGFSPIAALAVAWAFTRLSGRRAETHSYASEQAALGG